AQSRPATTQAAVHGSVVDHPSLKKLGWQLVGPTAIFQDLSIFEALDFLHALDLHHVEVSFNQPLSPEHPDWRLTPDAPDDQIQALVKKLAENKLDVLSYQAGATPNDEGLARKVFEVAKKLKAKNIV